MNSSSLNHINSAPISTCSFCNIDRTEDHWQPWQRVLMRTECAHRFHLDCIISDNFDQRPLVERTCKKCGVKLLSVDSEQLQFAARDAFVAHLEMLKSMLSNSGLLK